MLRSTGYLVIYKKKFSKFWYVIEFVIMYNFILVTYEAYLIDKSLLGMYR